MQGPPKPDLPPSPIDGPDALKDWIHRRRLEWQAEFARASKEASTVTRPIEDPQQRLKQFRRWMSERLRHGRW
jgi:hypothetical protein